MISVFRLSSSRYPVNSGQGAAIHGGRWNPPGTEAIYAAQTASLAALEILAHYSILPKDFVLTEIRIPENLTIVVLEPESLPIGWDSPIAIPQTQRLGKSWVTSNQSAVLSVPSSIIPAERNFLLNPAHPEFMQITFHESIPFRFDPRLKP